MQHCRACAAEFQAWVTVCSDCGGPLEVGPLPSPAELRAATGAEPEASSQAPVDCLLAELPGAQADLAARTLALEGIVSVLECDGLAQVHGPGAPERGPLAVTLPVALFVAAADAPRAQEIVAAITEQQTTGDPKDAAIAAEQLEAEAVDAGNATAPLDEATAMHAMPKPDATIGRVLLLLAAAWLLLFLLAH